MILARKQIFAMYDCAKGNKVFSGFILSALLATGSFDAHATLSAMTARTIKGDPPELSSARQTEIDNNQFSLLHLVATDSTGATGYTYSSDSETAFINVIKGITDLKNASLSSITAALAKNSSGKLGGGFGILATDDAFDINGDDNFSLSGSTTAGWYYDDRNNVPVSVSASKTICEIAELGGSPYIKVSTSDLLLSTQYGDPANNDYGEAINKFRIVSETPFVCYAKPNIINANYSGFDPAVWNIKSGFIPQNIANPASNFPTTGSHNLFFYLTVSGVNASQVKAESMSSGILSAGGVSISLDDSEDGNPQKIKVTLTGPRDGAPGQFTPSEFKITAPTKNGPVDIYTFKLQKWFIAKKGLYAYSSDGKSNPSSKKNETPKYCNTTLGGYRVPTVDDYTNASGNKWVGINTSNFYFRSIGGGLFSEWGATHVAYYTESDWQNSKYWAATGYNTTNQYDVASHDGYINAFPAGDTMFHMTACVSP